MTKEAKPNAAGAAPEGAPDAKGSKQSLAALLQSWEEGKQPTTEPKKPETDPALAKRLEALESKDAAASYKEEMKSVVSSVKGDIEVKDFIVEAWLNKQADSNKKLLTLWENRDDNREAFDSAIDAMKPEFKKFWEEMSPEAPKNDGKKVAAAARRARASGEASSGMDGLDWAGMSDNEFQLKKAEVFRLAKSGQLAAQ